MPLGADGRSCTPAAGPREMLPAMAGGVCGFLMCSGLPITIKLPSACDDGIKVGTQNHGNFSRENVAHHAAADADQVSERRGHHGIGIINALFLLSSHLLIRDFGISVSPRN
jgi:hypothetical protein